jgi:hypothetical protein
VDSARVTARARGAMRSSLGLTGRRIIYYVPARRVDTYGFVDGSFLQTTPDRSHSCVRGGLRRTSVRSWSDVLHFALDLLSVELRRRGRGMGIRTEAFKHPSLV